jgi:RimJ/RimL family protein N-acetyltransferase
MGHPYWPMFDLEIRTPRLDIRYPDDDELTQIAALAAAGIHDPGVMPFGIPWTDQPSPQLERSALQFHWRNRADLAPAAFRLPMVVREGGQIVGMTDLAATHFTTTRQFETGSWLGRPFQGRGIGKEMRLATLTLGFVGLGADFALTAAWHDNGPSNGVTRSLGYELVGRRREMRRDEAVEQLHYRMDRDRFETIRRDDIELVGVDGVRAVLEIPAP